MEEEGGWWMMTVLLVWSLCSLCEWRGVTCTNIGASILVWPLLSLSVVGGGGGSQSESESAVTDPILQCSDSRAWLWLSLAWLQDTPGERGQ